MSPITETMLWLSSRSSVRLALTFSMLPELSMLMPPMSDASLRTVSMLLVSDWKTCESSSVIARTCWFTPETRSRSSSMVSMTYMRQFSGTLIPRAIA